MTEARKYIGTNPTGRGSLWCGAFMDLVLKRTGHAGGGNLACGYARYGTRVSGPQVGAIAVMGRRGGGHVGVVSGIDAERQSDHRVRQSQSHGRRIGLSAQPDRGLRGAGQLIARSKLLSRISLRRKRGEIFFAQSSARRRR